MLENISKRKAIIRNFTLMEMVVVIAIIALMAAIVTPVYFNYVKKAKVTAARTQIGLIEQAIFDFRLDTGGLPSSLAELRKNTSGKEQWDGPYLKKAVPKDPWKNEYVYSVPGEHGDFDLMSYGSDGQPGGDGDAKDIGNWSNEED